MLDISLDQLAHGIGALFGIHRTDFGADRQSRRYRDSQTAHFGEVGSLAAQQILHVCGAISLRRAENIYELIRHIDLNKRIVKLLKLLT